MKTQWQPAQKAAPYKQNRPEKKCFGFFSGRFLYIIWGSGYFATAPQIVDKVCCIISLQVRHSMLANVEGFAPSGANAQRKRLGRENKKTD